MKILHITSARKTYGLEKFLILFFKNFSKKFELIIGNIQKDDEPYEFIRALRKIKNTKILILFSKRYDLLTIFSLYRLIKSYNINLLHTHGYKANIIGLFAGKLANIPVVTTLHGWTSSQNKNLKLKIYEFFDKFLVKYFDKVITVSEDLKRKVQNNISKNKLVCIKNAVDLKEISNTPRRNFFLESNEINRQKNLVVGYVGRLSSEKGCEYLIHAIPLIIKKEPDVKFIFIGDGPDEQRLKRLTSSFNLSSNVFFVGYKEDVLPWINSLDIFVLPSLTEGISLSCMEAMALKIPVVVTSVGGTPEIINKNGGLLVPPRSPEALANKISLLLKDPKLREKVGIAGRNRIKKCFNIQKMIKEYEKIYEELLN